MPLFLLETVQDGHETTYATTHHFFTTSHVIVRPVSVYFAIKTYQNYQLPPQRLQNSDFSKNVPNFCRLC